MRSKYIRILSLLILPGLILAFLFALAASGRPASAGAEPQSSSDGVWSDVSEASIQLQGQRLIIPDRYRTLALDPQALTSILQAAPADFSAAPVLLSLPLPDGGFARFQIVASPIMAPELAAKFPQISTYAGRSLDDPAAVARLDWTPHGFHAMILSPKGSVYIDPYSQKDTAHYISYATADFSRQAEIFESAPIGDNAEVEALVAKLREEGGSIPSGDELRTYRLAMAATGEYTIFHGGTVPDALAEIVTAMNRVNGIYQADTAIHMELVANTDDVIFTNPATDPYDNNNGGAMLGQNQATLDAIIGSANYDVGHVFSTGGGGVAFLAIICNNSHKAKGVTGLSSPVGDPFYVDYVAHEMGHQFGGNHTFNGNAGACAGGNRNASTAWEPGSGTTIQAYAGICGNQDIQPNSDDHFHTGSIDEIRAHTVLGGGNSCAAITATGNSAPDANAGADFTIPINTPFTLTGSATDPDGDPLTYNWEEFDLGPAGHPDSPSGNAPIFRSFPSKDVPSRIFPQISDIVNNVHTLGELLPSYARTMNFRFTVRDNHLAPSAGGVDTDLMLLTVSASAGPFQVTAPNSPTTWQSGTLQTVSWNVANTDASPVSCANVDIRLSTDGGFTYPVSVEAGVPNDGTEQIVVPDELTTTARIQVVCSNNVFFDISNTNFTIEQGAPTASLSIDKSVDPIGAVDPGDVLTYTVTVANNGSATATASITDTFPAGLTDVTCNGVPGDLDVVESIEPAGQASFECTAEVDSGLSIELSKTVDQTVVNAGETVTYTLTVTNPHGSVTLTDVLVTDPDAGVCTPALGVPFDLGPGASQTFVCPDVVVTETVTNTANVTAELLIDNQAQASAPEDPAGVVSSEIVSSPVALAASASATVEVSPEAPVFRVFLPLSVRHD